MVVELTLASAHIFGKGLVQVGHHLLAPAHHACQVGQIVLHIPAIGPSIVLIISFTGRETASEAVVKVGQEAPILILRVEETRLGIPHVAVVVAQAQILLPVLLVTPPLGNA